MRYSPCQLVSWISSINSYVAIFHQTVFRQRPGREQINSSVAIRRFTHFQVRSVTWAEGLTIWKDLFMGILMAKKGGIHLRIPRFQASVLRRKRVDIFLYTYLYIWYIYIYDCRVDEMELLNPQLLVIFSAAIPSLLTRLCIPCANLSLSDRLRLHHTEHQTPLEIKVIFQHYYLAPEEVKKPG